jgi:CxxC-x17-CxxC domain-containing protein
MSDRSMTEIKCSDCGKTATVPFKPTAGKPVYCRECLAKHRTSSRRTPEGRSQSSGPSNEKQAWSRRREGWKGRAERPVTA